MNQWKTTDWDSIPFENLSRVKKRERLFREANFTCPNCGFDKRRPCGRHVLEIDHIDGNHRNESRNNLRVLCPNCHALTPNFRNWGRSTHKTSSRLRRENKGFNQVRQHVLQQERELLDAFKHTVIETFQSGEIDYSQFGWVQRLSEKLKDRKVRKYLPDFFIKHCFFRKRMKT